MHRHNGLGGRGDFLGDGVSVDIICDRVDVNKYRFCPDHEDDIARGDKAKWRGNDLVAGPDAQCEHAQMQCA
ncbi:hypothetical protein LCGC14_2779290, partial [marine sediment metagenome]